MVPSASAAEEGDMISAQEVAQLRAELSLALKRAEEVEPLRARADSQSMQLEKIMQPFSPRGNERDESCGVALSLSQLSSHDWEASACKCESCCAREQLVDNTDAANLMVGGSLPCLMLLDTFGLTGCGVETCCHVSTAMAGNSGRHYD